MTVEDSAPDALQFPPVKDHWANVRALGCCVSKSNVYVTLHHCHGGSMIDYFGDDGRAGMALKMSDYLVIPLAVKYHVNQFGVDSGVGVRTWERMFAKQVYYLHWVNHQLPYCIFDAAGYPSPFIPPEWEIHTPAGQPIGGI